MKRLFFCNTTFRRRLSRISGALTALVLIAGFASGPVWAAGAAAADTATEITVYKSPLCGCCSQWVAQLQTAGFDVHVETLDDTSVIKTRLGVPEPMRSCHTAVAGDYWVEGHVPPDLIRKLLQDKPTDIKGIAVPGMVAGSPGMESPNPRTYQVLSIDNLGQVAVYATREGQSRP